ncbi:hypothetical protein PENTCL1PPCAC_15200 [Pristionchus entomophagus]|uniref:G protein-coupled receptor n=1 Tax=Pristionchus entomophagus TaxID=358040 RepID=A0AAV5TCY7_9BILA|nr:hypothetical protein PENTCL1PPCAC_15200 [Pristionchus entomophagus]
MLLSAFDIMSILDGFNYRCRVLIQTFYPQFTNRSVWIGFSILVKIIGVVLIGGWLLPIGMQLNRDTMRVFLEKTFPNAFTKFDSYKTFVVYDKPQVTGELKNVVVIIAIYQYGVFRFIIFLKFIIFRLLRHHRNKMSAATRKMHSTFK